MTLYNLTKPYSQNMLLKTMTLKNTTHYILWSVDFPIRITDTRYFSVSQSLWTDSPEGESSSDTNQINFLSSKEKASKVAELTSNIEKIDSKLEQDKTRLETIDRIIDEKSSEHYREQGRIMDKFLEQREENYPWLTSESRLEMDKLDLSFDRLANLANDIADRTSDNNDSYQMSRISDQVRLVGMDNQVKVMLTNPSLSEEEKQKLTDFQKEMTDLTKEEKILNEFREEFNKEQDESKEDKTRLEEQKDKLLEERKLLEKDISSEEQKSSEEKKSSLVEDFANPLEEMPSYMDPED